MNSVSGEVASLNVVECRGPVRTDYLLRVLRDECALAVFRGAIDPQACERVHAQLAVYGRLRPRKDNVPGQVLGAFYYLKSVPDYLQESAESEADLSAFFTDLANPMEEILARIGKDVAAAGLKLRRGRHGDRMFCPYVLRSWESQGPYQLLPHDDWAQLSFPGQSMLEFSAVGPTVCSLNLCIANRGVHPFEGAVRIWNLRGGPRESHTSPHSGYPYELSEVDAVAFVETPVQAGDVYAINGRYVHAVSGSSQGSVRVTMATTMACLGGDEIIYWS